MSPQTSIGSTVLIVDDTPSNLSMLFDCLNEAGYKVLVAEDGKTALRQIRRVKPDLILLDIMMPGIDGFETCLRLKQNEAARHIPIIFMTALADTQHKIQGFRSGGVDYITKPFHNEEVLARINTHLTLRRLQQSLEQQNFRLRQEIEAHQRAQATVTYLNSERKAQQPIGKIFAASTAMQNVLKIIKRVSATDSTVLIEGETGTGKELLAHAIHNVSSRQQRPLVKMDCSTILNDPTAAELYDGDLLTPDGTGSKTNCRFELANGGTLFLDEVSELPLSVQSVLLKFIRIQEAQQAVDNRPQHANIRFLASTNKDLWKAVENGLFREDLFYFLNVVPLQVPPLRERKEDIPLLVNYFFEKHKMKLGTPGKQVDDNTLQRLVSYCWPGNVRELENVIERAMILSEGSVLKIDNNVLHSKWIETDDQNIHTTGGPSQNHQTARLPKRSDRITDELKGGLRQLGVDVDPQQPREQKGGSVALLSKTAFEIAIKSALQHYVETDILQQNPLLFCHSVNVTVGTEANIALRIECLRSLLKETTASFAKQPKTEIYARILYRTYYQPARSQEIAAEALGISYSTFRRHLAKARSWLTAELWQLEQQHTRQQ